MLKRAHDGTFHKMSPKGNYPDYLTSALSLPISRVSLRKCGIPSLVSSVATLLYRDLIADNGLSSGARS